MMTPQRREMALVAMLVATLTVAAGWCFGWMGEQRSAAEAAAADLAECRTHADFFKARRNKSTVSSAEDMGSLELGKRVETSMLAARIAPQSLDGIFTQPVRPAGDSAYMIQPATLPLKGVSLGQLADFLYDLTEDSGLAVREIRLQVPRGDVARTVWDAEATVTSLVYAPPTKTRR